MKETRVQLIRLLREETMKVKVLLPTVLFLGWALYVAPKTTLSLLAVYVVIAGVLYCLVSRRGGSFRQYARSLATRNEWLNIRFCYVWGGSYVLLGILGNILRLLRSHKSGVITFVVVAIVAFFVGVNGILFDSGAVFRSLAAGIGEAASRLLKS